MRLKLATLATKFWPRPLHGVSGCFITDARVNKLRAQAVRALKQSPAGSSAMLRLSLAASMLSDPGFYRLWNVVTMLGRMIRHIPDLLDSWRVFVSGFTGQLFQGPFSQLMQALHGVGWQVLMPPRVCDEEGLIHDLLAIPTGLWRILLERAWLRHVGLQHSHRKTMAGLAGMDVNILRADNHRLGPLDQARQAALQSGAFLFEASQARFDTSKTGLCPQCAVPDDHFHRICHCPRFSQERASHDWVCAEWDRLPTSLTHHLLPPANPHGPALRRMLAALPSGLGVFLSRDSVPGRQHLFTDGAGHNVGHTDLATAAWGVVHAGTGKVISGAPLSGLYQTVPRAELSAVISAVLWSLQLGLNSVIWSDSLNVLTGALQLQDDQFDWADHDHHDLWALLDGFLKDLPAGAVAFKHIPSHLVLEGCTSPFDEWVATWNNYADLIAGIHNSNRSWDFVQEHHQAASFYLRHLQALRALRSIYSGIAEATLPRRSGPDFQEEAPAEVPAGAQGTLREDTISDLLPLNWRSIVGSVDHTFPREFTEGVIQFVQHQDELSSEAFELTWLELVVMFVLEGSVEFPVPSFISGHWESAESQPFAPRRLTLAVQLRTWRRTAVVSFRALSLSDLFVACLSLAELGFCLPLEGIRMGCDCALRLFELGPGNGCATLPMAGESRQPRGLPGLWPRTSDRI